MLLRPSLLNLISLFLLLSAQVLPALDSLVVGPGRSAGDWTKVRYSSRFIAVNSDSIWMWDVVPHTNLSIGNPERDGGLRLTERSMMGGLVVHRVAGGEVLFDGDGGTAFDPDEFVQLARTTPLYLDLGGTFRINRIRLFPRLDRQHLRRFLQEFTLATSAESIEGPFQSLFAYTEYQPNFEPVLDRRFTSRDVRYLRLESTTQREWELAEWEVYGDGTVPVGEFISKPLKVMWAGIVWGKVRVDGGDLADAPMVLQTRTGPDDEPRHFYRKLVEGEQELERVGEDFYWGLGEDERGPIKPNPEWSGWATVTDEVVRSPSLRQYLQFRVQFSVPGARVKRLAFEYIRPAIAEDLAAEIHPAEVPPGEETRFTLSMEVHLKTKGNITNPRHTGFRRLQVRTAADINRVEAVRIDDRPVFFVPGYQPGEGFSLYLTRRVEQNGSFVQVEFTGTVFRARTRFEVSALDERVSDKGKGKETAYQVAREGDVDPLEPGGTLTVRLEGKKVPLIAHVVSPAWVFTPNGDGINDEFELSYSLLKLLTPATIGVEIYDLSGRRMRVVYEGADVDGQYRRAWDGTDEEGRLVPPGLYLYQVRVEADQKHERQQGVVGVVY